MHIRFGRMTLNTDQIVKSETSRIGSGDKERQSGVLYYMSTGQSIFLSNDQSAHVDTVLGADLNQSYTGAN